MIRALSITAYRQFRNGAKQHVNMESDILKARLSSLIDSVDQSNTSYYLGGKKYRFGSCILSVDGNNYIRRIEWLADDLKPLYEEIMRLKANYSKYGLNKQGTKFINNVVA